MVQVSVTLRMDSLVHGRLASGVMAYAAERPDWEVTLVHLDGEQPRPKWSGDGLINCYHSLRTRRPQVLVSPMQRCGGALPMVELDHGAAAEQAYAHLRGRGLTRFGVVGYPGMPWSSRRVEGFVACCEREGVAVSRLTLDRQAVQPDRVVGRIASWLGKDPAFDAVFAVHDQLASYVIRAAKRCGLAVPERLAVVGVDDLELICRSVKPALSSVVQPFERIGYRSAAVMDAMLGGGVCEGVSRIAPGGVHGRGSTERAASGDELVALAKTFMLKNLHRPLGVEQVAAGVGVTRTTLARRFHRAEGRSPLAVLAGFRLEHAKHLLRNRELDVGVVARRCGFGYATQFSRWFRQQSGQTPSAFRERDGGGLRH
ncbi:MAG: substrate-binding domain-containing protein [Planctomycetota bacterium]